MKLLFDWDIKVVPVSSWTMAESGSKQILLTGVQHMGQITLLLDATAAGTLTPTSNIPRQNHWVSRQGDLSR